MSVLGALGVLLVSLVAGVLVLALSALLVPVHVSAHGVFRETLVDAEARVAWGPGLVVVEVGTSTGIVAKLLGLRVYRYRDRARPSLPRAPSEAARTPAKRGSWRAPRLRTLLRIAQRALESLRLRAELSGRVGTGDPAGTAALFATLAMLRRLAPGLDLRRLTIDWLDPAIELEGRLAARIWPVVLIWIGATELVGRTRTEALGRRTGAVVVERTKGRETP